ncbi:phosphoglycerate/bisphosphoglycerate mutase family protein [Coccidioides immitis H538.4]|uniref:Phosphoglycerate/bisphosphoglycerate mutase family protein n=1 Tax=Coccidioides immitis H538.4 TaxID=396776 RepID=A0A0J8RCB0_COCIT|nr:phosphoglycerate/bisphosphoglycerate mutase family protein [Coccidioides immitis H538.4]
MGKPRLIILIRHAQSEGNKNREIHQTVPDHRVKLTPEGHRQALEAGRRLRAMLRPDDTLHFFTSPYRRTRETTEGILTSLTSDDPSPSPFPRNTIKVYEEPRLREQDFGNFQPCSAAMEKDVAGTDVEHQLSAFDENGEAVRIAAITVRHRIGEESFVQKQNSQPAQRKRQLIMMAKTSSKKPSYHTRSTSTSPAVPVNPKPYLDHTHQTESEITRGLAILQLGGGRDAGGSRSGATSRASFASNRPDDEDLKNLYANGPINPGGIDDQEDQNGQTPRPPNMLNFAGSQHQLRTTLRDSRPHAMANSLGDTDDNGLASRRSSSSLCSNDEDGAAEKDPPPPSTNGEKAISDELQDEEEAVDMIKEREQGVQASVY